MKTITRSGVNESRVHNGWGRGVYSTLSLRCGVNYHALTCIIGPDFVSALS